MIRAPSKNPLATPKKTKAGAASNPDVIVISDDEQPTTRRSTSSSKHGNKPTKRKAVDPIADGEILEILSSGEDVPKQAAKRKTPRTGSSSEVMSLRQKLKESQNELSELRQRQISSIDASQLEDNISCEICTLKMWSPYILPECGHVFCQTCLSDWFSTTLTQYMTSHPNYNQVLPVPYHLRPVFNQARNNPHLRPQFELLLAQYRATQGDGEGPMYTCPTCREVVKNKPVEDFKLKGVVRIVADALGETSPRKRVPHIGSKGPWDGFFSVGFVW